MGTFTEILNFTVVTCPKSTCGVTFGVTRRYEEQRRDDHKSFHCPNGHTLSYSGPSPAEKRARELASKLERAEAELEEALDARWLADERAKSEARRRAALKGVVTKQRKRMAAGICPVPGCKRSGFNDVSGHIASKHPGWHLADEDG